MRIGVPTSLAIVRAMAPRRARELLVEPAQRLRALLPGRGGPGGQRGAGGEHGPVDVFGGPSGTVAMVSSVAGFSTAMTPSPSGLVHAPSM